MKWYYGGMDRNSGSFLSKPLLVLVLLSSARISAYPLEQHVPSKPGFASWPWPPQQGRPYFLFWPSCSSLHLINTNGIQDYRRCCSCCGCRGRVLKIRGHATYQLIGQHVSAVEPPSYPPLRACCIQVTVTHCFGLNQKEFKFETPSVGCRRHSEQLNHNIKI